MMTDQAPPMDSWLSALRDDVRPMSAQARARLTARLAGATVVVAGGVALPALSGALRRGFLYSRAFTAAVALPVGALLGAAGHAYLAPAAPAPVAASLPVASLPVVVAPAPLVPPHAPVEPAPAAPSSVNAAAVSTPSAKAVAAPSLERELSLLERARTRLSEGQPQATLQLLREHQSAYPTSALQQEREALTIRALVAAGRLPDAQRRAQSFVQAYPTSALRASVERAVGTIP